MTATPSLKSELLRTGALRDVLGTSGPCITIFLAPHRPGEPTASHAALLKSYVREASQQLAKHGIANPARDALLKPLEVTADDPAMAAGDRWGRVILRSPSVWEEFSLTQSLESSLTISNCFAIRKLSPELTQTTDFHILNLSKTGVSLLRCSALTAQNVNLPASVPATLAEALALEPPDHDLENRSSVGVSTGSMHRLRFGTGSEREKQSAHLADYYRLVDRGIRHAFHSPDDVLLIAGVAEDTTQYQAVASYPRLIKTAIAGSFDFPRERVNLLKKAYSVLLADSNEQHRVALKAALERSGPARILTDPQRILDASFEGRIDHLFLNQSAKCEEIYGRIGYKSWDTEDILNLAAVQTMIHRGRYCELPDDDFPEESAAIGILRF